MKMDAVNNKVFYQYKILVQLKDQLSIESLSYANLSVREVKNNLLRQIYEYICKTDKYIEFDSNGKFISIKKNYIYNNDILVFKLAKKKSLNITAKKDEFVDEITNDYPYSLVILDVKGQTFYVEKNYKLFQKPSEMSKILIDFLSHIQSITKIYKDANFLVNLIVDKQEFIECFNSFDMVNKVSLKLNSPNSFLGNQKADDFLNTLRDETNAQETKIDIVNNEIGINSAGFMKHFDDLFEYAVNGGGEWSLQGKEKGKKVTKHSAAKGKSLVLNIDVNNIQVNANEIVVILEKENRYEKD